LLNAKKQAVFFGRNGNAIAAGRFALMVMVGMLPAIVVSCSMLSGRDWLIPACGKRTKTISQTDEPLWAKQVSMSPQIAIGMSPQITYLSLTNC
jgi:hypothetical protein